MLKNLHPLLFFKERISGSLTARNKRAPRRPYFSEFEAGYSLRQIHFPDALVAVFKEYSHFSVRQLSRPEDPY